MSFAAARHGLATPLPVELPAHVLRGRVLTDAPRRLPSGVDALDHLLGGGWPRGRLSELFGPISSGKTSLLLTSLGTATRNGEVVAYVDTGDALHPESLLRAQAQLQRVLWVRPTALRDAVRCTELILRAGGFATVVLDFGTQMPRGLRAHVWPRLARAAERAHTALIVAAPYRTAGSFAALSVGVRAQRACWLTGHWTLFDGFLLQATLTRTKLGPPGASAVLRLSEAAPAHL